MMGGRQSTTIALGLEQGLQNVLKFLAGNLLGVISMRRDMNLIRLMLLTIESSAGGYAPNPLEIAGYTPTQIGYHAHILIQSGMINGSDFSSRGHEAPIGIARSLTWTGHEFLDAARDNTIWNHTMKAVKEKAESAALATVLSLLSHYANKALGLP